jgi:hypothetical protein
VPPGWTPPPGVEGDAPLLRAYVSAARPGERSCLQYRAVKARPNVVDSLRQSGKRRGLEMFGLQALNDLLDMIEFEDLSVDQALRRLRSPGYGRPPHPALARWAAGAATRWLAVGRELRDADGPALAPAPREWVVQWRPAPGAADQVTHEVCAWGRRYVSTDLHVRELRIPRTRSVKGRRADDAERGAAAFVLAKGREVRRRPARFTEAHVLRPPDQVQRVRVVEVGCEDGSHNVLFNDSPDEAVALYNKFARGQVRESVDGGEYRPGYDCADCALVAVCPAVPKRPGFLGIDDRSMPRRSWSATDGRYYAECPAREYQRRVGLPPGGTETPEVRRGRAVHTWLERCHERVPVAGCGPDDGPREAGWCGEWSLTGDDELMAAQMLGDHASVCPLNDGLRDQDVRVEQPVVVYDPAADVVVIAKPDLAYCEHGSWVLREFKTSRHAGSVDDPFRRYPQLALGLVLLAEGALGGDPRASRVELESLTSEGPVVRAFHPSDPDHLAYARRLVRELAAPWHGDLRSEATPGDPCRDCEFISWCPDAQPDPAQEGNAG